MALEREQTGALLELYFEAEERIIEDMARRIAAYDYFIPAAQHQMKSLEQMGKCREDIYRQLSELTGRSENELAAMLRQRWRITWRLTGKFTRRIIWMRMRRWEALALPGN